MSWWKRIFSPIVGIFRRPNTSSVSAQLSDQELVLSLSTKRVPSWKQLRFLSRILGPAERRLTRLFITAATVSVLFIVGHYVVDHATWVPTKGGTLTEGLVGTPQYINPVLARPFTPDTDLTNLLYRGLLKLDEKMNLVPDLADTVSVSADGKVYTVTLKKAQRWSDGSLITPADVVYTYETVADANYQSPYQNSYTSVKVAQADDHAITFTLPSATPSFRAALTLGILPSVYWQDQTPQTFALTELNVKPVTSGPMKFQSVTKDRSGLIRSFTFTQNKLYSGRLPYIDKLNIKLYPDMTSAIDALHSDAIDSLGGFDIKTFASVQKDRVIRTNQVLQLTGVFFNEKSGAIVKIPEIRKALALATDRTSLLSGEKKHFGQVAYGPLLPGIPGYSTDLKKVTTDTAAAAALLDQAGWKAGADGIRSKNNQQLSFTLTTVSDEAYQSLAEGLIRQWSALGIKVALSTVSADTIQKNVIKGRQYEALLFGQLPDLGGDLSTLWHSSQQSTGLALAAVYNKNIDAALDKARSATDQTTQAAALVDFQNLVVDQVPAIIIAQNSYLYAHEKALRGFTYSEFHSGDDHFDGIEHWYLKTKLSWK